MNIFLIGPSKNFSLTASTPTLPTIAESSRRQKLLTIGQAPCEILVIPMAKALRFKMQRKRLDRWTNHIKNSKSSSKSQKDSREQKMHWDAAAISWLTTTLKKKALKRVGKSLKLKKRKSQSLVVPFTELENSPVRRNKLYIFIISTNKMIQS